MYHVPGYKRITQTVEVMSCYEDFVHISMNIFEGEVDEGAHLEKGGRDEDGDDVLGLERRRDADIVVSVRIKIPI